MEETDVMLRAVVEDNWKLYVCFIDLKFLYQPHAPAGDPATLELE